VNCPRASISGGGEDLVVTIGGSVSKEKELDGGVDIFFEKQKKESGKGRGERSEENELICKGGKGARRDVGCAGGGKKG